MQSKDPSGQIDLAVPVQPPRTLAPGSESNVGVLRLRKIIRMRINPVALRMTGYLVSGEQGSFWTGLDPSTYTVDLRDNRTRGCAMKLVSVSRWLWVAFIGMLLGASVPSSAEVLKIVVNDAIHPITEEYIERALGQADRDKDQALLIELNTPGGLLESTRSIIEKILASPVPVIIYVTPGGSRAASAAFFILESADVAAMAPGTNTGAAHPVVLGGGKMDDVMKEKMENDAAALMRSVAARRGRNVDVAESTVRQSKSFTEQEALSQHLIDYVASSEEDLFRQIESKSFKRFSGEAVSLKLSGQPIVFFGMTLKESILNYLMDPN